MLTFANQYDKQRAEDDGKTQVLQVIISFALWGFFVFVFFVVVDDTVSLLSETDELVKGEAGLTF